MISTAAAPAAAARLKQASSLQVQAVQAGAHEGHQLHVELNGRARSHVSEVGGQLARVPGRLSCALADLQRLAEFANTRTHLEDVTDVVDHVERLGKNVPAVLGFQVNASARSHFFGRPKRARAKCRAVEHGQVVHGVAAYHLPRANRAVQQWHESVARMDHALHGVADHVGWHEERRHRDEARERILRTQRGAVQLAVGRSHAPRLQGSCKQRARHLEPLLPPIDDCRRDVGAGRGWLVSERPEGKQFGIVDQRLLDLTQVGHVGATGVLRDDHTIGGHGQARLAHGQRNALGHLVDGRLHFTRVRRQRRSELPPVRAIQDVREQRVARSRHHGGPNVGVQPLDDICRNIARVLAVAARQALPNPVRACRVARLQMFNDTMKRDVGSVVFLE